MILNNFVHLSVLELLCLNLHWWSWIILYTYELNCERRILDKILYGGYNSDMSRCRYPLLYEHPIYEFLLQESVLICTCFWHNEFHFCYNKQFTFIRSFFFFAKAEKHTLIVIRPTYKLILFIVVATMPTCSLCLFCIHEDVRLRGFVHTIMKLHYCTASAVRK
jgi:hypothetical protein